MIYPEQPPVFLNFAAGTPTRPSDYEMDSLGGHQQAHREHTRPRMASNTRSTQSGGSNAVGVALLLVVVSLWTASGFVTQILYRDGYDKPFIVTYTSTSLFTVYLAPRFVRWLRRKGSLSDTDSFTRSADHYQPLAISEPQVLPDSEDISSLLPHDPCLEEKAEEMVFLSVKDTAKIAFFFCWLWFIANWAINAALNYTTVASSTIIASTSGFFTLGLGQIFGVERFTMFRGIAVLICFAGVVLVSLSDTQSTPPGLTASGFMPATPNQSSQPIFGDFLAFISAIFYAFYVVFLKVKVRDESQIDMRLFLGFVGLFDLVTCWPVGLILHWVGMEELGLPVTKTQCFALLANMAILVFSDYLYVLAMFKTTPLLATIGISLSIPIAVLGDFALSSPIRGQVVLGAVLVLLSFIAIGLDTSSMRNGSKGGISEA